MRAVLQRVRNASVSIQEEVFASIGQGLLVFLSIHREDTAKETGWMIKKILGARLFEDEKGRMGKSVEETGGELLVVSEITLYGDMDKGKRPDFSLSMRPQEAKKFYEAFMRELRASSKLRIEEGDFGARMDVRLVNDGPVTILLESG